MIARIISPRTLETVLTEAKGIVPLLDDAAIGGAAYLRGVPDSAPGKPTGKLRRANRQGGTEKFQSLDDAPLFDKDGNVIPAATAAVKPPPKALNKVFDRACCG